MNSLQQIKKLFLAFVLIVGCLELGSWITGNQNFSLIATAEAIIGRPLTPVSVAGVARRTVRRCAVGVYYCN
jgi:hypothetical protein